MQRRTVVVVAAVHVGTFVRDRVGGGVGVGFRGTVGVVAAVHAGAFVDELPSSGGDTGRYVGRYREIHGEI